MNKQPQYKFLIVIIVALLIPILSYTVLQFLQRDRNEEMIKSIYDRQLESILFSVNQHCWDIFSTWLSEISSIATNNYETLFQRKAYQKLQEFIEKERVISGIFLRFSENHLVLNWAEDYQEEAPNYLNVVERVEEIFKESEKNLMRRIQLANEGYVKPMAFSFKDKSSVYQQTILLFPIVDTALPNRALFGGIIIDNDTYVREIVARRFASMNEGDFIFGVTKPGEDELLYYSSEEEPVGAFEKSTELWILPHMDIKVKMSGTTLGTVSRRRMRLNLILLVVVNVIFFSGLAYLIKNIGKEMELAQMKTNFVANVSHELRTPIALIRMYAETLEMGRVADQSRLKKYYRTILGETARLSKLINNILDFSKIESKKKSYQMSPTDLQLLVEQALEMYRYHLQKENFELDVKMDDVPNVNIDSEAITQAFVNLLDNAIKYSGDEKRIQVLLKNMDSRIALSVKDFGIGIPESEQKKIFDKFYRVGSSLVHNTKGSGLGLSLVKHIMDVHGGDVQVNSESGKGSTFSLVFPA